MKICDFIYDGYKDMLGKKVDNMKDDLTDEEMDLLSEYYFGNYAKNNHDEIGCDYWMSNLTEEEARAILKAKDEIDLDLFNAKTNG